MSGASCVKYSGQTTTVGGQSPAGLLPHQIGDAISKLIKVIMSVGGERGASQAPLGRLVPGQSISKKRLQAGKLKRDRDGLAIRGRSLNVALSIGLALIWVVKSS
jgi:hypothetical protein